MAADPRWVALESADWEKIADALDFAAFSARNDAEEIRRGYSDGTDEERGALLAKAGVWSKLAEKIVATRGA